MTSLSALWMPIVLSSILVFFASSLIHMMLGYHNNDYPAPPNQDAVADALRPFNLAPGDYMFPKPASMKDMGTPEFKAKAEKGPKAIITVLPKGLGNMGALLGQWFVYSLVIAFFSAYVASATLAPGAPYLHVFQVVGTVTFLAYAGALWQATIWYGKSAGISMRSTLDGLIYALLTAGTFGWLWPK